MHKAKKQTSKEAGEKQEDRNSKGIAETEKINQI